MVTVTFILRCTDWREKWLLKAFIYSSLEKLSSFFQFPQKWNGQKETHEWVRCTLGIGGFHYHVPSAFWCTKRTSYWPLCRDVENFFSMSDIRSDKLRKFVRPNENMPDRIYILHNSTPFFFKYHQISSLMLNNIMPVHLSISRHVEWHIHLYKCCHNKRVDGIYEICIIWSLLIVIRFENYIYM